MEADSPLRKLAAGGFLGALACLLLPFFHVSCAGNRVMTVRGTTLVVGGQLEMSDKLTSLAKLGPQGGSGPDVKLALGGPKANPDVVAIAAACAMGIGLVLSLRSGRRGARAGVVASILAIALLFALKAKIGADVKNDATKSQPNRPLASAPGESKPPQEFEGLLKQQMDVMIQVEAGVGFILAVVCLAAACVLDVVALVQMKTAIGGGPLLRS